MKIYLCGPMTHRVAPDLNRAAFAATAAQLRADGHRVFNPGANPDEWSYAQAMSYDLETVLLRSDAVVVLPRWEEGVGSRLEVAVALAIGLPVYGYGQGDLVELYPATAGRDALRSLLDGGFR